MNAAAAELAQLSEPRWLPAYVGVGSNLDDPRAQVAARARRRSARLPRHRAWSLRSPLYRTRAVR